MSDHNSSVTNDATALIAPSVVENIDPRDDPRADTVELPRPMIASNKTAKNRLVALGLSLCVAGAVLAYRSSSMSTADAATTTVNEALFPAVPSMNLASDQTPAKRAIENGRPFLLSALSKNNLCVDDGGGTKPGQTAITL